MLCFFWGGFIPEIPEIHHHLPSGSFIPPKWGSKNWWIPPSDWQATHILLLSIETYHAKNCFIMKLQERRSNFFSSIIKTSGVFFPARMYGMFIVLEIYHKEWSKCTGKYTSPMDGMGWIKSPENRYVFTSTWPSFARFLDFWLPKSFILDFFLGKTCW